MDGRVTFRVYQLAWGGLSVHSNPPRQVLLDLGLSQVTQALGTQVGWVDIYTRERQPTAVFSDLQGKAVAATKGHGPIPGQGIVPELRGLFLR